jgi:uncharacterized MAPEG superfamily protein
MNVVDCDMTFEYKMLGLMTTFFILAFLPASLAKVRTFGIRWAASNRDHVPHTLLPLWGQRAERAHSNLKDNFPGFIVAILLLGALGRFDETTSWLAGLYVLGRLAHFFFYVLGISLPRTLGYSLALTCNIALLIRIIT